MQVLVQRSGDGVLDRCFDRVRCETRAYPLAETGRSATPLARAIAYLCDAGASCDTCHRQLTKCASFPLFYVGMALA